MKIAYRVLMGRLSLDRNWLFRRPWAALAAGLVLVGAALSSALPIREALEMPLTSNIEAIGATLCLPAAMR